MCGIVGFAGREQAAPILLDGLERLEYRGYDSAGIAVLSESAGLQVKKAKGRLKVLSAMVDGGKSVDGFIGVGHTRWATHGEPNYINSHPHTSEQGKIALVHNGIIENYAALRDELKSKGFVFRSETDTEVLVKLIDSCYTGDPLRALQQALAKVRGSYALAVPQPTISGLSRLTAKMVSG